MKKILVIHNEYREYGGEDNAVKKEINFLKLNSNYKVNEIIFSNNSASFIQILKLFIFNSSKQANKKILNKISEFNPDLIYIHNTWFYIFTKIFKILNKGNYKVAIKLHNFRYSCTDSVLAKNHFKGKNFCRGCGNQRRDMKILNKYYLDSIVKSIFVLIYGKSYIKVIKNNNFKLVVLTNFHKKFLIEKYNIDEKNIYIIPNYLDIMKVNSISKKDQILYAGRISKQKGVKNILEEFLKSELKKFKIVIFGDGPELKKIKSEYESERVIFRGIRDNNEVLEELSKSRCVITATKMNEGQPTLLCEASLIGIPSIFPNNGGINEFFPKNYELMYDPNKTSSILDKLNLLKNQSFLEENGKKNQKFIRNYLNEENIYDSFDKLINSK